jgi:superfamily II DNA/RNA helicase
MRVAAAKLRANLRPRIARRFIRATHLRSNKEQRIKSILHSCYAGCLLATDVAARGLDIPDVGWVLQVRHL